MLRAMWASRTVYMVRPSFGGGSTGRGPPCARQSKNLFRGLYPHPGDDRGDAELRLTAAMNGSVRVTLKPAAARTSADVANALKMRQSERRALTLRAN